MGILRRFINQVLSGGVAKPSGPAASTFGAGAERRNEDRARKENYELEIAKQKGRPRGM